MFIFIQARRLRAGLYRDLLATNLHVKSSFIGRWGLFVLLSDVRFEWDIRMPYCNKLEIRLWFI